MGDHRLPTRAKRGSHTAFLTQACMFSPVNSGFQHTPALTYPLPFRKAGTALASSLLCSASASLGGELVSETGKAGQSIDPAVHCQAGLKRARYAHTRAALGRLPCCSGGAQDASDFHRAEPEVEAWPGSHSHSRTSLWEPRLGLCSLLHICHHICPAIMKMCSAVTADCHADDPVVR